VKFLNIFNFGNRRLILSLFLISFIFTAFVWLIGYWYLLSDKNEHVRVFLERQTERQQIAWNAITNVNKAGISAYFETYVQKPEVAKLLDVANHGDESQKAVARAGLYKLLLPVYDKLLSKNIEQFHFQDAENNSFLRFHLPEKYGDSLNSTRPAIVAVNKYKKAVFGFETGKVALSFRNVFPIEYEGRHIGSVDMGQPFDALEAEMEVLHKNNEYVLTTRIDKVLSKLFDKNKLSYTTVSFDKDWIIENRNGKGSISDMSKKLLEKVGGNGDFKKMFESGHSFSYSVDEGGKKYAITAIPIIDTEGKHSAVLLSFVAAPELEVIDKNHISQLSYFSFILLILFLALSRIIFIRKKMDTGEKKLAAVTQIMGEGMYILNADGEIEYINKSALEIFGFSYAECIGKTAHYLFHSHSKNKEASLHECQIYNSIKSGKKYIGVDFFLKKNGDIFAADIISSPLLENDVVAGSVTVFRDITDRIKMEEELRVLNGELGLKVQEEVSKRVESEKTLGMVFEKTPEGMIILSEGGKLLECNPSAAKILGYSVDELKNKTVIDISPDMQSEYDFFSANAVPMFLENAMSGETQYLEWTHVAKDGTPKLVEVMLAPMVWHGENVILCTWKDITELKKLQLEKEASQALMIQQNKLAEMGAMIGAIAHQWKQPLNAIWLMIQDIKISYDYGEITDESMDKFKHDAGEQVTFMKQTIEDFRSFYKPSASATVFLLSKSITSVISIIKKQLEKDDIKLIKSMDDEILILGMESEFKQVVLNIVNNAKDALLAKEIEQKNIWVDVAQANGKAVVKIADNAGGIDEKLLATNKLFEPYFSTKGESGTGIGLSLSKIIVEKKMNGKLTARNKGDGAEFTIELAVHSADSEDKN